MNKKLTQAGNTVIEILIATVIVGLILTSLALSLTNSIQNSAEAQYRETGSRLAQDAMEVFRKDKNVLSWGTFYTTPSDGNFCVPASFDSISTASPFTTANLGDISSCGGHTVVLNNITYHRAFTKLAVTDSSKTPPVQYVKITVFVYWNVGIAGKERSTSVEQTFYKVQ